ncbi:hypothetical protein FIBSPDRAFT_897733 [Athelia psychrophila]|uniref:Ankyrin n=1 Tax=Athelia psychrophila TaxID=1759441 RepID=A0A166BTV6_9AGAM|nr:hypothetical protein FIBSPDRAFT_897733 [Fibularhizoctonia sp. CBS 109695]
MSTPLPTDEEKEEIFLSCRYGDLEDIQEFVNKFGPQPLSDLRDESGNTTLHMICGNGHTDVLDYVGSVVPPALLSVQNSSQSTAMHWAALNQHLPIMQKLVSLPGGPGIDLIDIKNAAGRSPLGEAEMAGWQEGAQWLVEVMNIDTEDAKEEGGDEVIDGTQDVEVEIEDADGQISKMTISGSTGQPVEDAGKNAP